ncbi:gamma-glutamylcyclotransferase [[Mycobacterium] zoologicum]|uniref:gamma-glutamylcyclotransferase family protein n=1 Tax=[Mycobacterium] zoologicum TaxID=2872311 RepID=UPI001CD658D4
MTSHVFVYGTLMPGQCRWPTLAMWADGPPEPDSVDGELFDTGFGYPAAVVGPSGRIPGFTVALSPQSLPEALAVLDGIEGTGHGLYQRISIVTEGGTPAWIYTWPTSAAGFTRITEW